MLLPERHETGESREWPPPWRTGAPADTPSPELLQPLCDDIARRLSGVCAHFTQEQFEALVLDIARFELRWRETDALDRGGGAP